jgi:hypothetical protein
MHCQAEGAEHEQITLHYERYGLENLGPASKDSSFMRPLQSVHRRTGMESYMRQVTSFMLPEQGSS